MTVLRLQNVTASLGKTPFLKNLNLALNTGELVAIVGPNGAGKSTLLKTICGDLPGVQGDIFFHAQKLRNIPSRERARNLAVLPQHSSLNFAFSAKEVVALGRIPHSTGLTQDNQIVASAMRALDISHLAERLYPRLSGGEKQRVQLARVLAQIWQPNATSTNYPSRLLLLDEPTAHIDLGHQQQLMTEIKRFTLQGVTVLLVLHDINLAIQYADKLVAMTEGRIEAVGAPEAIINQPLIDKLFGKQVRVMHLPDNHRPIVLPV